MTEEDAQFKKLGFKSTLTNGKRVQCQQKLKGGSRSRLLPTLFQFEGHSAKLYEGVYSNVS